MDAFDSLLPPGEGARRADEGKRHQFAIEFSGTSRSFPHPALRATFSRREKEKHVAFVSDTTA